MPFFERPSPEAAGADRVSTARAGRRRLFRVLVAVGAALSVAVSLAEPDKAAPAGADGQPSGNGAEGRDTGLFQRVIAKAKERSEQEYTAPAETLPEALTSMDYSEYRGIRFRRESSIWLDHSAFRIELFHPGFLYTDPVTIQTVADGSLRRLLFDAAMFRYSDDIEGLKPVAEAARGLPEETGFAGFRVHYPLNTADYQDEVVVFQGASYFRMVGPGQNYGLSARGLAINTASSGGEEFPAFREFWLARPEADKDHLTIYALLDSPSLTGAYRFRLEPGTRTRMEVASRLFVRQGVDKLGVAPLTSMFLYGENKTRFHDDFRPEVHDSDGLLIHTAAGEWIWRALSNPASLRVTSSQGPAPRGFGLVQRDRDFNHYLDTEARYDERPSLWVTPSGGDWGKGRVELVEIPSDSETNDNIVAYWVPGQPVAAGDTLRFDYTLTTFGAGRPDHDLARAVRTRIGWAAVPGMDDPPPRRDRQFTVEFEGRRLARLGAGMPVEPVFETSTGTVRDLTAQALPGEGRWRVSFKLAPEETEPADMQLRLELRGERLTETWNYVWSPNDLE